MLILPEWNKPFSLDSLTDPLIATHFWALSGQMTDFYASPILYLEETTGPTVRLLIDGFEFDVPTSWHMLITDGDTYSIDSVSVTALAGNPFKAVLFSPTDTNVHIADIGVIDYHTTGAEIHPLIPKGQMMCHPIGTKTFNGKTIELCCILGPYDLQRYLNNLAVGDLLA